MVPDFAHLSDDRLVLLCSERGASDDRPWAELFRRHRQLVWGICRRYFRGREDVADMVQETFLHAVRGLESFEGGHPALFRAWLVRVAGNTCKNELRHRARRLEPVATEITAEMAVVPFTTDRDVDAASRRSQLKTALETLSASEREILQLAELEELSYREIASRLEISLSAVKMRVVRARVALAGALRALRPEVTPS